MSLLVKNRAMENERSISLGWAVNVSVRYKGTLCLSLYIKNSLRAHNVKNWRGEEFRLVANILDCTKKGIRKA